jgi:hypothetical protein
MTTFTDSQELAPEIRVLLLLARPEPSPEDVAVCREILLAHLDDFDWGYFVDQAAQHKVLPIVGRHFVVNQLDKRPNGAGLLVSYGWVFDSVYFANKTRNETLFAEYGVVLAELARSGVEHAVRKGPVVAEGLYRDPGLRRMYDLDILVARADVPALHAVLARHGYAQGKPAADGRSVKPFSRQTRLFWKVNIANELPYVKLSDRADVRLFCVDLCLDIFQREDTGELDTRMLLSRRVPMRLCGVQSFALAPEDQFIDLCLHLHKEATSRHYITSNVDLQLLKFLDVALASQAITAAGLWAAVQRRVAETGSAAGVYYALHYTALLYPDAVTEQVLAPLRPDDLGYLDEYGALDGSVRVWQEPFLRRLFHPRRSSLMEGSSTVPL